MKKVLSGVIALLLGAGGASGAEEINIYTARHYDTDFSHYSGFTEETGIKINVIEGGSDQLIERISREGEFSPADILMTVDAGRIWRAEEAGLFQTTTSEVLEARVPAHLRHPEGQWYGLSKRARIIIYNKEAGRPEGLNDYEDLADEAYRGQICARSSSNIYNVSLLASMVAHHGEAEAETWATGVTANFARPPSGGDRSQIEAVAAGECTIGFVNSYYLGRYIASDKPEERGVYDAIGIIFPNQDNRGTHVNLSGAGVLKYAPNPEGALKFIEYLSGENAQRIFSEGNNEYPIVADMEVSSPVAELGSFKEDDLNARELGVHQAVAIRIFDRAGWR